MIIYRRQLEGFPNLTKMFQKFLDGHFQMTLASGHNGNGAFLTRVFQLPVGDGRWRIGNCCLWNQRNAVARRHKCLNGRNLAAAKDNAGTEIVLAAKTHCAIAEAVVFLTQNEFFGLQIFLENCPFAREWMTRMKR
jgi:hypothetical protein